MTLDVAIVGCGRVAGEFDDPAKVDSVSHVAAFNRNENFRVVGCVDLDKRKVSLSIKLLEEIEKKDALDKYGSEGSGKNLPFSSLSEDLKKKEEDKD